VILVSFWALVDQRETINQFKENDLKYRYIKMQGQTNEENLYRLERQFKNNEEDENCCILAIHLKKGTLNVNHWEKLYHLDFINKTIMENGGIF